MLCYDNDNAGRLATQRALEILDKSEFTVRVLKLPNKMVDGQPTKQDADDFIKNFGPDAFERLLSGSENGIEFRIAEVAGKFDLSDDRQRVAYAEEVSGVLAGLENAVEREIYTARAAEAAGLTAEALRLEVDRAFKRKARKEKRNRERREMSPAVTLQPAGRGLRYENLRSAMAEEGVIRLLMQDDGLFGEESPLREEEFSSPMLGKIYTYLWQSRGRDQPQRLAQLGGVLSAEEMAQLTALLQKPQSAASAERALGDYVRVIREEAEKRGAGPGMDPLAAACEKYKQKKGYGGKQI